MLTPVEKIAFLLLAATSLGLTARGVGRIYAIVRRGEGAFPAGKLPRPDIAVAWSPPRFEAVDPLKDAMADLLAMRSGTMTLAQAIARQGHNPDAVLAEIAAMNARLDALGIVLDSDPRRVTKTGVLQSAAEPLFQEESPVA